jgi:excinuclease ABC subunit C
VAGDHEAPASSSTAARATARAYFGPFASAGAVGRTINALQKRFLLRTCSDSVYESRTRPCLLYQIKRCSGPCTGEISLEGYAMAGGRCQGVSFGQARQVKAQLASRCSSIRRSGFRTRRGLSRPVSALSHVQSHQGINPRQCRRSRRVCHASEGGQFCMQVFFFRTGQNWGNRAYFPKADPSLEPEEVLQSFIGQFYDTSRSRG